MFHRCNSDLDYSVKWTASELKVRYADYQYRGIVLCQIRTLKRYGWLASTAIWLNLLVVFLSVGFIAHSPPNYASAKAAYGISEGPVVKQTFASYPFFERVNGVMNIVYA